MSSKYLEMEKVNASSLSTMLMSWAKIRLKDTKLLTFASVTLVDEDFYEGSEMQDLCNIM